MEELRVATLQQDRSILHALIALFLTGFVQDCRCDFEMLFYSEL